MAGIGKHLRWALREALDEMTANTATCKSSLPSELPEPLASLVGCSYGNSEAPITRSN